MRDPYLDLVAELQAKGRASTRNQLNAIKERIKGVGDRLREDGTADSLSMPHLHTTFPVTMFEPHASFLGFPRLAVGYISRRDG